MPGQWTAGGETAELGARMPIAAIIRCGSAIGSTPATGRAASSSSTSTTWRAQAGLGGLNWRPPFACPTHTALPLPFEIRGRRYLVVADEDVQRSEHDVAGLHLDGRYHGRAPAGAGRQLPDRGHRRHVPTPVMTACHQPCEKVTGSEMPFAWFAHGLRIIDVGNPHAVARGRLLRARRAGGNRSGVEQRCDHR